MSEKRRLDEPVAANDMPSAATWSDWLDRAAGLIRFGPDRAEVRAELRAHLEDKTADLRRIFPDMTEEEAGVQALREMGDAVEIGKEMARLHRPWLGYLWMASRVLLGLALALLAVELLLTLGLFWGLIWPI